MSRREPESDVPGKAVDTAVAVPVDVVPDVAVPDVVDVPLLLFLLLAPPWLSAELSSSINAASWPRSEFILCFLLDKRKRRGKGEQNKGNSSWKVREGG